MNLDTAHNEVNFPAIEVLPGARLLLEDCSIRSGVGSAIVVSAGGSLSIEGGRLSSNDFLGLVLRNEEKGKGGSRPLVSCRGCLFTENLWGCFLSKDVDEKVVKSFIAANKFRRNLLEDVTRMYEDQNATVQPWRSGWETRE